MYDRRNSEFSDRPERCQGAHGSRNAGEADLIKETVQVEIETGCISGNQTELAGV